MYLAALLLGTILCVYALTHGKFRQQFKGLSPLHVVAFISLFCLMVVFDLGYASTSSNKQPLLFCRRPLSDWFVVAVSISFCCINYKSPSCLLLLFGTVCNRLAITANGGFMPVSIEAAEKLFGSLPPVCSTGGMLGFPKHCYLVANSHLYYLCDIFYFKGLGGIISIGDILIVAAIFALFVEYLFSRKNEPVVK